MKRKTIALILFLAAVILQLLAQVYVWPTLDMISKPLLMPTLATYFFLSVEGRNRLAFYMVIALMFSWFGDVFLMFQQINGLYFIIGLVSFLLAHITYVIIFRKSNVGFKPKPFTYATGFLMVIYGMLLLMLLWPGLSDMKVPVVFYTFVIMTMGISALFRKASGSSLVLIGAILFISSDSLLAINKFSEAIPGARFWVMASYILAQFTIVAGMIEYFNSPKEG